ncbi:hypothetical protein glysoja_045873 [Glycine soja]|uniref:Uncharacterized protein n=1 Tax=Glycine soja TaxID=3848 RepID=A0A0B2SPA5_GLYSO|nr:hypothetical protein glysoja_045873 [Glycine soja]
MASRKRARTEDIPSSSTPAPSLQELAHNRPIISMEHFLEQVNPEPADPQSPVVNPPSSPELEAVPPSPPLIVISDASSNEVAAPPDSSVAETADPLLPQLEELLIFLIHHLEKLLLSLIPQCRHC